MHQAKDFPKLMKDIHFQIQGAQWIHSRIKKISGLEILRGKSSTAKNNKYNLRTVRLSTHVPVATKANRKQKIRFQRALISNLKLDFYTQLNCNFNMRVKDIFIQKILGDFTTHKIILRAESMDEIQEKELWARTCVR